MQIRDCLEEHYREVFAKGFEKLSTTSNVLELLPDCDTDADRLKALIDCTIYPLSMITGVNSCTEK